MRRNSSNLPIKGHIVANLDPAKKQLPALQVRDGVLVCVTACHVEAMGSIPVMFHYTRKIFFLFLNDIPLLLFLLNEQLCTALMHSRLQKRNFLDIFV